MSAGKSYISLREAVAFFDQLANRRDLALGYIRTSCYPKAYMMCESALEHGCTPFKAWAFEGNKPLKGVHPSGGEYNWWHHVALALPVKLPNGEIEKLIFDPAVFDAPVALGEWAKTIGAAADKLAILPYEEAPPQSLTNLKNAMNVGHSQELTRQAQEKIATWAIATPAGPRLVFESHTLNPYKSAMPVRERKGWDIVRSESHEITISACVRPPAVCPQQPDSFKPKR